MIETPAFPCEMLVSVRAALPEDSLDIWAWRNDKETQKMSVSQTPIGRENHEAWYNLALTSTNCHIFIGLDYDGKKIGVCRFDYELEKNEAAVSINLNPAMRGKLLSSALLSAAMKAYFEIHEIELSAVVRKENQASARCFIRCGFLLIKCADYFHHYRFRPHKSSDKS
jgi:RimJ/RimL family protein N-acetyltransferase